jgi:hypothetical protein
MKENTRFSSFAMSFEGRIEVCSFLSTTLQNIQLVLREGEKQEGEKRMRISDNIKDSKNAVRVVMSQENRTHPSPPFCENCLTRREFVQMKLAKMDPFTNPIYPEKYEIRTNHVWICPNCLHELTETYLHGRLLIK